jgi:hypothetical protein
MVIAMVIKFQSPLAQPGLQLSKAPSWQRQSSFHHAMTHVPLVVHSLRGDFKHDVLGAGGNDAGCMLLSMMALTCLSFDDPSLHSQVCISYSDQEQ